MRIIAYLHGLLCFFWVEKLLFEQKPVQEEKRFDDVPWTIQQTKTGLVLTLLPWLVLTLAISLLNGRAINPAPLPPGKDIANAIVIFIFSLVVHGAFLIAPFHYALRPYQAYPRRQRFQLALRTLGFTSFSARQVSSLIIACLLAIFVLSIAYAQLVTAFHLNVQTNDQFILKMSKATPFTTYAILLEAVLVAPFCEEIFFRGFVLPGLLKGVSVFMAIFWCALLFGLAHGDVGSFVVLFGIGLALSFLRWRTRSIWPSIILHMSNNGLSALLIVLVMRGAIRA